VVSQQMGILADWMREISEKEDNFVHLLDNITSKSLYYEKEMTTKQNFPPHHQNAGCHPAAFNATYT